MLDTLDRHNVFFVSAGDLSRWFMKRRHVAFNNIDFGSKSIHVDVDCPEEVEPGFVLRIYHSDFAKPQSSECAYRDVSFFGSLNQTIYLKQNDGGSSFGQSPKN